MEKDIMHVRSDIEDLAFKRRSWRVTTGDVPYCRRGCIEHDFAKGLEMRASTGTVARVVEMGS